MVLIIKDRLKVKLYVGKTKLEKQFLALVSGAAVELGPGIQKANKQTKWDSGLWSLRKCEKGWRKSTWS